MRRARKFKNSRSSRWRSLILKPLELFSRRKVDPKVAKVQASERRPSDKAQADSSESQHWFRQYWQKVGGGSLTVSIGIHLLAALIALFFITATTREASVDFLPGGSSKGSQQASAEVAHQVQRKHATFVDRPMTRRVVSTGSAAIKLDDLPMEMPAMPSASLIDLKSDAMRLGTSGSGEGFGNGVGNGGRSGFTSLPPAYSGRCSHADRLLMLKESGGTPQCEAAVERALQWLKTKQNADGSWGQFYQCGMTGFALLCYLGHCETTDSAAYGPEVTKAAMYLLEIQKKNRYGIISRNILSTSSTYEHGICTYALGELYGLSHSGNGGPLSNAIRAGFEKGMRVILDQQMSEGSWAYASSGGAFAYSKAGERPDLSVTGWQFQALKAAHNSGLNISGVNQAIEKTARYLENTQTQDGGFGITKRESGYNQWNLSGVALLGLETLGHESSPAINRGMAFALKLFTSEPPDWHKNANLYCWYYYSQAFFQRGGREWQYWNDKVLHQLLENQAKDGSWQPESFSTAIGTVEGSTSYGAKDQDIYRVVLCTLMLEVYYRYLKVGGRAKSSVFDR